jgi:hypothetical protein
MNKTITTVLAAACLGLVIGRASAAVPFANYNLSGNYVIEAHGFLHDGVPPGESAIFGVVSFDGVGNVVPGAGLSFSLVDSLLPTPTSINCSVTINGGQLFD